ncbi:iron-containing alcohol dehydrogenase [Streptomyces sp. cg40]|uniref:iron-containing alcohol dehydrogenase n=1 Tax=Streptomyces sp. cg40 TaxID=3419764 RepID=UPI003CFD83D3
MTFGSGTADRLLEEVRRLGGSRVLLLSSPPLAAASARVRDALRGMVAAEFDGATMHTALDVTERALTLLRAADVDCIVAVGGGSTMGLSKTLAFRTDLPQVIVPTRYASSGVTSVLGETHDGRKTT